jgi:hypothetical protein
MGLNGEKAADLSRAMDIDDFLKAICNGIQYFVPGNSLPLALPSFSDPLQRIFQSIPAVYHALKNGQALAANMDFFSRAKGRGLYFDDFTVADVCIHGAASYTLRWAKAPDSSVINKASHLLEFLH